MYFTNDVERKKNVDEITTTGTIYSYDSRLMTAKNSSKSTQTDYRDSEAQTVPWEPPYKVVPGSTPAVLTLTDLTWGNGLPAGIDELKLIRRMKVKKAWELVLPPLDNKTNVQVHKDIIAMIDNDEWRFRDNELQFAINSKLDWMNRMINMKNNEQKIKFTERFEKVGKHFNHNKIKEINQIKRKLNRELRKLNTKYREKNLRSINKNNIIHNKFTQCSSKKTINFEDDFYLLKSKLDNQSFYDMLLNEKLINEDSKKQNITQQKNILPWINQSPNAQLTKKNYELCLRQTRWTDEKLNKLHDDLKSIRLNMQCCKR